MADVGLVVKDVSDSTESVTIEDRYGIRFPDGSTSWGSVNISGRQINVKAMIDGNGTNPNTTTQERRRFKESVEAYLSVAGLDPDEYIASLKFVTRKVILTTTKPESIRNPLVPAPEPIPF